MGCSGESVPNFHYFYERNGLFLGLLKRAYYQSGEQKNNSPHSAERIDPSAFCRVRAFCLNARTRNSLQRTLIYLKTLKKEISNGIY
jgi:hypothetical protein